MEAAKEKESNFRRHFEATAGEIGARSAVLAFRPAVREAGLFRSISLSLFSPVRAMHGRVSLELTESS